MPEPVNLMPLIWQWFRDALCSDARMICESFEVRRFSFSIHFNPSYGFPVNRSLQVWLYDDRAELRYEPAASYHFEYADRLFFEKVVATSRLYGLRLKDTAETNHATCS